MAWSLDQNGSFGCVVLQSEAMQDLKCSKLDVRDEAAACIAVVNRHGRKKLWGDTRGNKHRAFRRGGFEGQPREDLDFETYVMRPR